MLQGGGCCRDKELVRPPGRARDVGRRQPPPCPLRNRWAQPERSGMSQPPCQGQPWVWLSLTLSPGAPWAPGAEVLWSFSVPGCWTLPPGASREEDLGPAPPLRQLPAARRARYVEQKSAAQGSGPRVRPGPGAAPAPGSPAPTLCIPRAVPARRRTPPPLPCHPRKPVSLWEPGWKPSMSSDMGNTQPLARHASGMGWGTGEGLRR